MFTREIIFYHRVPKLDIPMMVQRKLCFTGQVFPDQGWCAQEGEHCTCNVLSMLLGKTAESPTKLLIQD